MVKFEQLFDDVLCKILRGQFSNRLCVFGRDINLFGKAEQDRTDDLCVNSYTDTPTSFTTRSDVAEFPAMAA